MQWDPPHQGCMATWAAPRFGLEMWELPQRSLGTGTAERVLLALERPGVLGWVLALPGAFGAEDIVETRERGRRAFTNAKG